MVVIQDTWTRMPCDVLALVTLLFGIGVGAALTYIPLTLRLWKVRQRLERAEQKCSPGLPARGKQPEGDKPN